MLSAQTTDKRVNLTTPALFAKYPTADDMAAANPEDLEEILKPTGFFRAKTKSVMGLSAALRDDFGGEVPRTLEELVKLPGVGRKTANVVLGNAFDVPGITVDTHFGRLVAQVRLDHRDRPGQDRARGRRADPAQGLDDPVAPADLARPPHLPRAAARVRRLPAGAAVPLVRRGARPTRRSRRKLVRPGPFS